MKTVIENILKRADESISETPNVTGLNAVTSEMAKSASECLRHQTKLTQFFNIDQEEDPKIMHAPLTNSGCESRMADLSNWVKHTGGSMNIFTISNREVNKVNKALMKPEVIEDLHGAWNWAQNSTEAREARQIQKEFLESVTAATKIAYEEKKRGRRPNSRED